MLILFYKRESFLAIAMRYEKSKKKTSKDLVVAIQKLQEQTNICILIRFKLKIK